MSKLAPKRYGERPGSEEEPKKLEIRWVTAGVPRHGDPEPPKRPEPPRQIPYRKPELPADLTAAGRRNHWLLLMTSRALAPAISCCGTGAT
jgi:hypothetical protein